MTGNRSDELRAQILRLTQEYYQETFGNTSFTPGESPVRIAGRVFDEAELHNLIDASLDFWLTTGRYAEQFERNLAQYLSIRHALLCNSGSSANLLAISALTSPSLKARQLLPGDEVITLAAGFPTTVNPIVQNQLVPVFLDVDLATANVDVNQLEAALSDRTRAVMMAHTLGNPFDLKTVTDFVRQHNLWLIEDNCDALGSQYDGKFTGTFGDIASLSFYPAHQITMGEGGAVLTNRPALKKLLESFRDWGRDCWCAPGDQDTCGKRFDWQLGEMPAGYDHKYLYAHIGYNLKVTDMQAAIGVAQLRKLPDFVARRRRNWQALREGLAPLEEWFTLPEATPNSEPCWFGFMLTIRPEAPFDRQTIVRYLEDRKIATRMLFGGNLTRQPAYQGRAFRVAGTLKNTDLMMNRSFWIGVYPALGTAEIEYMIDTLHAFTRSLT